MTNPYETPSGGSDVRRDSEKPETERTSAEGDATIRDLEVQAEADVQVILAEGRRFEDGKKSEGDRPVAEAVADFLGYSFFC